MPTHPFTKTRPVIGTARHAFILHRARALERLVSVVGRTEGSGAGKRRFWALALECVQPLAEQQAHEQSENHGLNITAHITFVRLLFSAAFFTARTAAAV